jgi:hypothetical protein
MGRDDTTTTATAPTRREATPPLRKAQRAVCAPPRAGIVSLLLSAACWLASSSETASVRAAAEKVDDQEQVGESSAGEERAVGAAQPRPEVVPARTDTLPVTSGGGWFGYREARTGELVVPPPELLERFAVSLKRERARASAAVLERRLPNGAIEIDLPVELSSPFYGWIDSDGVLHTGHAPPAGLATKDSRSGERRGGR